MAYNHKYYDYTFDEHGFWHAEESSFQPYETRVDNDHGGLSPVAATAVNIGVLVAIFYGIKWLFSSKTKS